MTARTPHVCAKSDACICYLLATEPNDRCPIHGYPWPRRCGTCGRFLAGHNNHTEIVRRKL